MRLHTKYLGKKALKKIAGIIENPRKADWATTQKERLTWVLNRNNVREWSREDSQSMSGVWTDTMWKVQKLWAWYKWM